MVTGSSSSRLSRTSVGRALTPCIALPRPTFSISKVSDDSLVARCLHAPLAHSLASCLLANGSAWHLSRERDTTVLPPPLFFPPLHSPHGTLLALPAGPRKPALRRRAPGAPSRGPCPPARAASRQRATGRARACTPSSSRKRLGGSMPEGGGLSSRRSVRVRASLGARAREEQADVPGPRSTRRSRPRLRGERGRAQRRPPFAPASEEELSVSDQVQRENGLHAREARTECES